MLSFVQLDKPQNVSDSLELLSTVIMTKQRNHTIRVNTLYLL